MKRKREAKKDLMPINIDKNTWYYLSPRYIDLVHEIRVNGQFIRTDVIRITWKHIKKYLKDKELSDGK